jgi:putative holliday junction resolvase
MARTLALDVGNRRIGVAISDASKLLARPIGVIDRKREDALERLRALVLEFAPDEIVIGYPRHADGRPSDQATRVEGFAAVLRQAIDVPQRYYDERHSTQEAREIIATQKRAKQPQSDDAIAASVILQRYLDSLRSMDQDYEPDDGLLDTANDE